MMHRFQNRGMAAHYTHRIHYHILILQTTLRCICRYIQQIQFPMRGRTNLMTIFTQALHHTPSHKTTATQYQNIHFLFSFLFIIFFFILLDTTHHKDKLHVYQSSHKQNHRPDTLKHSHLHPIALCSTLCPYLFTLTLMASPLFRTPTPRPFGSKNGCHRVSNRQNHLGTHLVSPICCHCPILDFQPMATPNLDRQTLITWV